MKVLYDKLEGLRNKYTYLYVFLLGLLFLVVFISVVLFFFYLLYKFSIVYILSVLFVAYIVIMFVGVIIAEKLDNWYEK